MLSGRRSRSNDATSRSAGSNTAQLMTRLSETVHSSQLGCGSAPVAPQGLRDEHGQQALHGRAARVERIDNSHARAQARPQRPLAQQPRARVRPACSRAHTLRCT